MHPFCVSIVNFERVIADWGKISTHPKPIFPFSTPPENREPLVFWFFKGGFRKETLAWSRLVKSHRSLSTISEHIQYVKVLFLVFFSNTHLFLNEGKVICVWKKKKKTWKSFFLTSNTHGFLPCYLWM